MAKNFSQGPTWITGKILKKSGNAAFLVELPDGRVIRRHSDQLKLNTLDPQEQIQPNVDGQWLPDTGPDRDSDPHSQATGVRQSTRVRKPPIRYSPDND